MFFTLCLLIYYIISSELSKLKLLLMSYIYFFNLYFKFWIFFHSSPGFRRTLIFEYILYKTAALFPNVTLQLLYLVNLSCL